MTDAQQLHTHTAAHNNTQSADSDDGSDAMSDAMSDAAHMECDEDYACARDDIDA